MTADRQGPALPILASALVTGVVLGGAGALWLHYGAEIFMAYATGLGMICI